jgi:hypothetical protein
MTLRQEELEEEDRRRRGYTLEYLREYWGPFVTGRRGVTVLESDSEGPLFVRVAGGVWQRDPRPRPVGAEPRLLLLDAARVPGRFAAHAGPAAPSVPPLPPAAAPMDAQVSARMSLILPRLRILPDGAERLSEALVVAERPPGLNDYWKFCPRCWQPHSSTARWTQLCLACESAAVGVNEHIRKVVWDMNEGRRARARAMELERLRGQVKQKLATIEALSAEESK